MDLTDRNYRQEVVRSGSRYDRLRRRLPDKKGKKSRVSSPIRGDPGLLFHLAPPHCEELARP